jgi:hypothetical protein
MPRSENLRGELYRDLRWHRQKSEMDREYVLNAKLIALAARVRFTFAEPVSIPQEVQER